MCHSLKEYGKAETYHKNALAIRKESGNKQGEATCYGNLGNTYCSFGKYENAETYQEKALVILKEIGDKRGEVECYFKVGSLFR